MGREQEAGALLDALLDSLAGEAAQRYGSRIAILALLAAARLAEPARAQAALDEALRIGQPEGYLRTFVNAGEPMRQALKSWIEHHDPKDSAPLYAYAQRVLAAFDAPALEKPSHEPHPADLPEAIEPA